jgi:hypothetical protein
MAATSTNSAGKVVLRRTRLTRRKRRQEPISCSSAQNRLPSSFFDLATILLFSTLSAQTDPAGVPDTFTGRSGQPSVLILIQSHLADTVQPLRDRRVVRAMGASVPHINADPLTRYRIRYRIGSRTDPEPSKTPCFPLVFLYPQRLLISGFGDSHEPSRLLVSRRTRCDRRTVPYEVADSNGLQVSQGRAANALH